MKFASRSQKWSRQSGPKNGAAKGPEEATTYKNRGPPQLLQTQSVFPPVHAVSGGTLKISFVFLARGLTKPIYPSSDGELKTVPAFLHVFLRRSGEAITFKQALTSDIMFNRLVAHGSFFLFMMG